MSAITCENIDAKMMISITIDAGRIVARKASRGAPHVRWPTAARRPWVTGREAPRRYIWGMAIIPIVAGVGTLEPEMAAKIAHEKMLATARPAGRNDTQRATAV